MTNDHAKTVGIVSNSYIENDPRVRKFAWALHEEGWIVNTVGLRGEQKEQTSFPWEHHSVAGAIPDTKKRRFVDRIRLKRLADRLVYYFWLAIGLRLFPHKWAKFFWRSDPVYRRIEDAAMQHIKADLWIANDWEMLPIAESLQRSKGGRILYDSHEYATEQFMGHVDWKFLKRPMVCAVEAGLIHKADAIVSVSSGLCAALQEQYNLPQSPMTILNVPEYAQMPFVPTQDKIGLLYQGVVGPTRGLEKLVESARYWEDRFSLIIRGPVNLAGYDQELQKLIIRLGVAERCKIEPPVKFTDMISTAHASDIGLMVLTVNSKQSRYALPNKVFEYMLAGLAVGVSNHPEMASEITAAKAGWFFSDLHPHAISARLNALTNADIDRAKSMSLKRAKRACWDIEKYKLIELCEQLI